LESLAGKLYQKLKMGRIILDCDLMRFPNSGLYHYCLNLGNEVNRILEEQGRKRMKFYVPAAEVNSFDDRGDVIVEKPYHRFFRPFLFDCSIWHAPFQLGRIVPYKHKTIKVVFTIHDLNFLHEGVPSEAQRAMQEQVQKQINRADAIVCISEFTKRDVLNNCEPGKKPVYVIHNGTNQIGEPRLSDFSYRPPGDFLFGMGYVNKKKNFDVLIPLLHYNPEMELVIAGKLDDAKYMEDMKTKAVEWGVSGRLHIIGPVTEDEKAWYLQNCKAFMHPSIAEGFGFPVVEAMNFGKPLFLSSLTSLPEIGGEVAFFFKNFEPENMQHVFAQGMLQYNEQRMAEKIIQRGREFDWKKSALEYLEVYQSLLK
jgi:glycosyltransferase involved in cell wall biosynthesis